MEEGKQKVGKERMWEAVEKKGEWVAGGMDRSRTEGSKRVGGEIVGGREGGREAQVKEGRRVAN